MLGNHLLGLYEKSLNSSENWSTRLQKAKDLGFDFMEISIDETDSRIERLYWSREQIRELRNLTFDLEIPLKSMCLSTHRRFPLGSADMTLRNKGYDLMKRAVDFSCELGIRVIQLAGYDVYYEPSTEASREAFMKGMQWAADYAGKNQVMLAMEIMDTFFMNSIAKHLYYEGVIHSPWYKLYPDLGNLSAWTGDVSGELRLGINSIVAVHLKDTIKVSSLCPGIFKCIPFGEGCVDFVFCFKQLEGMHYTGPYIMEMWHQPELCDMQEVQKSKAFIEEQFCKAVMQE